MYGLDKLIGDAKNRAPDFIIGGDTNPPYIRRWYLTTREDDKMRVYLHQQSRDDDARAMHDHIGNNVSIILDGGYMEYTPEGVYKRQPGDVIVRQADQLHRLQLFRHPDTFRVVESWSLFIVGPKIRDWGFMCPNKGWIPWQQFCDETEPGLVGRGCD
jgi:hypothetical protein